MDRTKYGHLEQQESALILLLNAHMTGPLRHSGLKAAAG
jgi:hypothetical protein